MFGIPTSFAKTPLVTSCFVAVKHCPLEMKRGGLEIQRMGFFQDIRMVRDWCSIVGKTDSHDRDGWRGLWKRRPGLHKRRFIEIL